MLLRREKELWERERRLLLRERDLGRRTSGVETAATSPVLATGGIRGIKELLPEFDATDNTFWRWRQQLELLRNFYGLDENSMRILITSRLKGVALTWFYSRAEHVILTVDDLLDKMKQIFDLGKLSLCRNFESRVWKRDESFCDYYHDKVVLANRVPIVEDELLDYLIDGVTDENLHESFRRISPALLVLYFALDPRLQRCVRYVSFLCVLLVSACRTISSQLRYWYRVDHCGCFLSQRHVFVL